MAILDRSGDTDRDRDRDNISVYAIYPNRGALEAAVEKLRIAGFRSSDISVLFPTPDTTKEFAHTNETKAPEGATVGGSSGAVLGGTLGWLVGIGAVAIPGAGPFIAAGPIMSLLAGAGVGAAVGGLTGALIGMGIPEFEAKRYEGRIKKGGILLSVHCDDSEWCDKAKELLEDTGAESISWSSEASADVETGDVPRHATDDMSDVSTRNPRTGNV
jgi:hypothetical protein